jgi:hypothetical protein
VCPWYETQHVREITGAAPVHFTMPRGLTAPHCSRNVWDTRGRRSRSEKYIVPVSLASPARP